jgi:hypothetical protein
VPFRPGQSGNPRGRPAGIVDRRMALRSQLEDAAPELLARAIEMARQGDPYMMRLLLSRLLPAPRAEVITELEHGRTIAVRWGQTDSVLDA